MDDDDSSNLYTIRDVTENKLVKLTGRDKVYLIGLGGDGSVEAVETREESVRGIYVTLVRLTVCANGGMILSPVNKDLCCTINGDVLTSEINLLSGVPFEVADRTLKIYHGKVPSASTRRILPATPGVVVKTTPPPKPRRSDDMEKMMNGEEETSELLRSEFDVNLLSNVRSSTQLASLAASFLTKQINQYTDSKLSAAITDQIFSFLQEVSSYQKSILDAYITEISQSLEEMPESERNQPLHRPSVRLLVELLRQVMDPLSHVVLCLQLLRTFSHFPQNLPTMMRCQANSAVLGCMSVYLDVREVQQYGLDILARIATYKPSVTEKIPLREAAIEMILRAMKHHHRNIHVIQPGCRTLSNLTTTLQEVLDAMLETDFDTDSDTEKAVERYDEQLRHIFEQAIKVIQSCLQEFPNSLDVRTEGRRFLYNYSKMTQFMQKQKLRALSKAPSSPEADLLKTLTVPSMFTKAQEEEEPEGILKKAAEDITADRRVHFADDTRTLDYLTSSGSDSSDSEPVLTSSLENGPLLEIKETRILTEAMLIGPQEEEDEYCDMQEAERERLKLEESEVKDIHKSEVTMEIGSDGVISEVSTKFGDTEVTIATSGANSPVTVGSSPTQELHTNGTTSPDSSNLQVCNLDSEVQYQSESMGHSELQTELEEYEAMEFPVASEVVRPKHEEVLQEVASPKKKPLQKQKSYTVSDVGICSKIIKLKVTQHVSSLVSEGKDAVALSAIDGPLRVMLQAAGAPPTLLSYVDVQYEDGKTLMDIDTAFLISIVDAVRYKTLFNELLQKNITEVVQSLFEPHRVDILTGAVTCLHQTFQDLEIRSFISDKTFLKEISASLFKATGKLKDDIPSIETLTQMVFDMEPK